LFSLPETPVEKVIVNRQAVFEKNNAKESSVRLTDSLPSSDPAVTLDALEIRFVYNPFNPLHPDVPPAFALSSVKEVPAELH